MGRWAIRHTPFSPIVHRSLGGHADATRPHSSRQTGPLLCLNHPHEKTLHCEMFGTGRRHSATAPSTRIPLGTGQGLGTPVWRLPFTTVVLGAHPARPRGRWAQTARLPARPESEGHGSVEQTGVASDRRRPAGTPLVRSGLLNPSIRMPPRARYHAGSKTRRHLGRRVPLRNTYLLYA